MPTLFVLLLFLQLSTSVTGQERVVYENELKEILKTRSDENDLKVEKILTYNRAHAHDTAFYKTLVLTREYFIYRSLPHRAVAVGEELIQLTKKLERTDKLARHYTKLLHPLHITGEYEKQYDFNKRAMYYAGRSKDTLQLIIATAQLGTFFWYIDELDKAIECSDAAFELAQKYPDFDEYAVMLNNKAYYYLKSGKYDDALETLYKALPYCTKNYDSASTYASLGTVYHLCDSLELSEKYLTLSREVAAGNGRELLYGEWLVDMGILTFKQGKLEESEGYLEKAVEKLEKSSSIETLQESYFLLYQLASRKNDDKKALQYLELSNQYKDSVIATQNINALASRYYNNTILAKEREKERTKRLAAALENKVVAEKEARLYSNIMVIIAGVALVILGFWGWNYRKLQRLKQLKMQRQFSDKMELKNKQLASVHIRNINRSNHMREVDSQLSEISGKYNSPSSSNKQELGQELRRIKRMIQSESTFEWEDFRYYFEQINDGYFARIQAKHPKITNNDKKIIAYIKVGLDTKQIARLLNVTDNTAYTQRYRLRKKLNLPNESDLIRYLQTEFEEDK